VAGQPFCPTCPQPPLPSPTSTLLLRSSTPDAGGVTSKGQETVLNWSRGSGAPEDTSQQLGRGVHGISPRRASHGQENEQIPGASFSISISQGEFKHQPLSLLSPSHNLPPSSQVWALIDSQNTTFVATTYVATGGGGLRAQLLPRRDARWGLSFPLFRDSWYLGTHERTSGHCVRQVHGWSWPTFCWWQTSPSSRQALTPDSDIFSIPHPFAPPSRASSLRSLQ